MNINTANNTPDRNKDEIPIYNSYWMNIDPNINRYKLIDRITNLEHACIKYLNSNSVSDINTIVNINILINTNTSTS
jgi:hypothetical protein